MNWHIQVKKQSGSRVDFGIIDLPESIARGDVLTLSILYRKQVKTRSYIVTHRSFELGVNIEEGKRILHVQPLIEKKEELSEKS